MPRNRLAREKSPYLLQHADNPVDWFAWGEEAFQKARAENKPIFLSIGYSTCHWCHVMAHESFEDETTAAIMNREFVNVKVDREERPDVDRVYMSFVQATTGHGGWPMSVFLTPDLQPFIGGTYFPPEDRYGHPGFRKVLANVANAWREQRDKLVEHGARIVDALRDAQAPHAHAHDVGVAAATAYQQFARSFDDVEGGFGQAPKFPRPSVFTFLFRHEESRACEMALFTLQKMAAGGIHDHLGGGFHRYSVDTFWHVPHFEKMLYDQAQLAVAYIEAFQLTQRREFETTARRILEYVERDVRSAAGGFFSAEDADSLFEHGKPHRGEGAFYVWTNREIAALLGDDAAIFSSHFGTEENGNVRAESDPHHEFDRKNVLFESATIAETAQRFSMTEAEVTARLAHARGILFEARKNRPRPHLDDKIISAWNGLMTSAFAKGAQVFDDDRYAEIATTALRFIKADLFDDTTGILYRSYRKGRSAIQGFADDYAFVIQAALDVYETTFESDAVEFARRLQQTLDAKFWDEANGGYFNTATGDASILLRLKEDNDGAEPAPSSVAALNLLRLAQIFGDDALRGRAAKTVAAFSAQLGHFPTALPLLLVAQRYAQTPPRQIVIAGPRVAAATHLLLREARSVLAQNTVVLLAEDAAKLNPAIAVMPPVNGKPAAYVCENFTCQAPVTDPVELRKLLRG